MNNDALRGHRSPLARGAADLHMHSSLGDGLNSVPEILEWVEHRTNLDVISITDHDDTRASLEAREIAARRGYRFQIIPGTEVTTRRGHLLVYGLEEPPLPFRTPEQTAHDVAERGGWCIAPHPMSPMTLSLRDPGIRALCDAGVLLGVELINSSPAGRLGADLARRHNDAHYGVAETGGSDAHKRLLIGTAYTGFDGRTADDLVASLQTRRTTAEGRYWTARECASGAARVMGRAYFVLTARQISRYIERRSARQAR